jgi:hypothetical protein
VKSLLSLERGAFAEVIGGRRMSPWTLDLATLVGVVSSEDLALDSSTDNFHRSWRHW